MSNEDRQAYITTNAFLHQLVTIRCSIYLHCMFVEPAQPQDSSEVLSTNVSHNQRHLSVVFYLVNNVFNFNVFFYYRRFIFLFFIHLRNSHFLQLYTVLSLVDIIISYS